MGKREEMRLLKQRQKQEKETISDTPNPIEKMLLQEEQTSQEKLAQKSEKETTDKEIPVTKYGTKDKRYKKIKMEKKYPVSMENSLYDDLSMIAYGRKVSVNQLINEILKNGIDKEEVKRYRKVMEQFR